MRTVLVGIIAVALGAAAYALSPPAPDTRPGPIGWEKAVTPGYDPPIEYVVVFGTEWLGPLVKPTDVWSKWGPGAAEVLTKLYRDPAWSAFQERILNLLSASTAPETLKFLVKEYDDVIGRGGKAPEDQNKVSRLLALIERIDPKEVDRLVDAGLKNPGSPHFQTYVYTLMGRAAQPGNTDGKARLDEIMKTLPEDNPARKSIADSQLRSKSVQRGDEPMDVILKREKGGKP